MVNLLDPDGKRDAFPLLFDLGELTSNELFVYKAVLRIDDHLRLNSQLTIVDIDRVLSWGPGRMYEFDAVDKDNDA